MYFVFFFFFSSRRRHTRFSRDWSSDVCSSDLYGSTPALWHTRRGAEYCRGWERDLRSGSSPCSDLLRGRSEERRVGKECRSRWSPDHEKKNDEEGWGAGVSDGELDVIVG